MTSPSPLLYETYYHIYNRGINRENIFIEERNYDLFLRLYEKHLSPVADLLAYCMMKNHFHLALRVKSEDEILKTKKTLRVSFTKTYPAIPRSMAISEKEDEPGKPLGSHYVSNQFSNFFNAYAKTINKAYGRTGSLFQHPFGRVPITTDRQFWTVVAYIHQNPQKHGFVTDFRTWKYSSYGMVFAQKPKVIKNSEVMKWFGSQENYLEFHKQWMAESQATQFAPEDFN